MFELSMRLADWNDKQPCPKKGCKLIADQVVLPASGRDNQVPAITVHVDANGNYRFPGSSTSRVPKGFQKKELRTIREIETFERDVNSKLRRDAHEHQENEDRHFSAMRKGLRADLRQEMQHMSQYGKDFARLAMSLNDRRQSKSTDCGFHVEVLHFDQTNREAQFDASTDWKRRHR